MNRAYILIVLVLGLFAGPALAQPADLARMKSQAARVSIVRDDWGIAHVHGKTDADAVFGAIYAQAEDDFNRIEVNYLTNLGMTAEVEGEGSLWRDLRYRLYNDPSALKADYASSPDWLKTLMIAWADGLNFYLATHPEARPKRIRRFEPWMALSFTEGSIGGDIERINLGGLQAFYGRTQVAMAPPDLAYHEPTGSNGIAIGPQLTTQGHALLLINPHTSFFFRSELQMTSEEGLNAYGASTWGQFFIYQGFNETAGWMHTSSGVDAVDDFVETIVRKDGGLFYRYGAELRPVTSSEATLKYRAADGSIASRTFTVYRTHHGPIVKGEGDRWTAFAMMDRPVAALEQSFLRTKQHDFASFTKIAALQANSSNDTLFADAKGEIAYLHPQFIPRRDDRFDYTKPVDGSDPATDWKGLHSADEAPHLLNPPNGWIFNTNDWPYSAAGPYSPKKADYPRYMDTAGENPRGVHATLLLTGAKDLTRDGLLKLAFDPYLPAFADLMPGLVQAYDQAPDADPLKAGLKDQIALLRTWDRRWAAESVATSLAVFWGEDLFDAVVKDARAKGVNTYEAMAAAPPTLKLDILAKASDRLKTDFGDWKMPWGRINRFQRLTDDIAPAFTDAGPSNAVPFTSSRWGSLASFAAKRYPGTRRYYGNSGNSFVAVVEFGPRVRARAVTAGGESGDPKSPHFNDQALRYASGDFREVYFYPDQLPGHTERTYHPGE